MSQVLILCLALSAATVLVLLMGTQRAAKNTPTAAQSQRCPQPPPAPVSRGAAGPVSPHGSRTELSDWQELLALSRFEVTLIAPQAFSSCFSSQRVPSLLLLGWTTQPVCYLSSKAECKHKALQLFQFHHSSQCVSPFKPILLSTWSKAVNGRNLGSCEDEQNLPLCSSSGTAPTLDLSTLLVPPLTPACPSGMALSRVWVQTILVHRYSGQPSPC